MVYAGSLRSRQTVANHPKVSSSKRQGLLALAAVALIAGAIVGIRQEWNFTAHLTDETSAIHKAEAHHVQVVHLEPVPTPQNVESGTGPDNDERRRAAEEGGQAAGGQSPTPSPAVISTGVRIPEHSAPRPVAVPVPEPVPEAVAEPVVDPPVPIDGTPGPAVATHHEPEPEPKMVAAPAISAYSADGGEAAAFATMEAAAAAQLKFTRPLDLTNPRDEKREKMIQGDSDRRRERAQDVERQIAEAAAQQAAAEQARTPEEMAMPQVAIGPDGIPIPPKPHPLFAPVEILSIASTPEIRAVVKKANEKADSVGANLEGRDSWDLSGLHPRVMREGSNKIPGRPNRLVVVTFTDFRPDGTTKNQAQASMVINWVRHMKRHKIHCLVAICQKELSTKAAWVLLEEGWCVPFLATERVAMENPKVGRWWYVQEMLKAGYDVLSSDADVAWLRSPVGYFGRLINLHPQADVFTSTDSNDGVYSYETMRGLPGGHQLSAVPIDPDELAALPPLQPPSFKRTSFGRGLQYTEGYVYKPELKGKDGTNKPALALEVLRKGAHDAGLENPQECGAQWNTGVMYWRATPRAIRLLDFSKEVMAADTTYPENPMKRDDQKPINAALRVASEACAWSAQDKVPEPSERVCGDDPQLHTVAMNSGCVGVLPVAQFSNGFTFTVARLHEQWGVRPFSFHATYASDKVLKLREEGAWLNEPSRVNSLRVLYYDPKIPREMFPIPTGGGPEEKYLGQVTPWHHAALLQYQLRQLHAALAIAHVLQRTIVLPRFACLCECFYYRGLNCTIEGHRIHTPYICPTDHVLWGGGAGLKVPFLEPGFMDAPDHPQWFLNSSSKVHPCDNPGCSANDPAHKPFFQIPENWRELRAPSSIFNHEGPRMVAAPAPQDLLAMERSNDEEIFATLGRYHDVRVLKLNDPLRTWGGFSRKEDEERFRALLGEALGKWCCWGLESRGTHFQYELAPGEPDHPQYTLSYEWEGRSVPEPLGGGNPARTCNA